MIHGNSRYPYWITLGMACLIFLAPVKEEQAARLAEFGCILGRNDDVKGKNYLSY
jgi:hypothetical protein